MNELQAFKSYSKVVNDNVCSIILLRNDVRMFYEAPAEIKTHVFAKFSLIPRIQMLTYRALILGIYGLLKESENYSLQKLLRKSSKVQILYRDKEIEHKQLFNKLKELSENDSFKKISNLRNKYYAHLDINRKAFDTEISIGEVVSFTFQIEEFYKKVYSFINPGTMISFISLDDKTGHHLYSALLSYKNCLKLFESGIKNMKDTVELEDLRSAIFDNRANN